MRIDDLDEQILSQLTRNARATYNEIGTAIGLSAPAVKRRVDRLQNTGVIRGFTTMLDPQVTGWTTEAYVEVFCTGIVAPDALARDWDGIPEIVSAATVTGASDAILRVVARDVSGLERAIERIRSVANVDHTQSVIVLTRVIDRVPRVDVGLNSE